MSDATNQRLKKLQQALDAASGCVNDHDYICHCRPVDVRAALAEIERLREENADLSRGGIRWWLEMRKVAQLLGCGSLDAVVERVGEAVVEIEGLRATVAALLPVYQAAAGLAGACQADPLGIAREHRERHIERLLQSVIEARGHLKQVAETNGGEA